MGDSTERKVEDRSGRETEPLVEAPKAPQPADPIVLYVCMSVWIFMSATVILFNKYLLSSAGFQYPITLTTIHMAFCSLVCAGLVRGKVLEVPEIPSELYWRAVVPIGALFSFVLAAGNGAYLYLSVSFIQMLKASQPAVVFIVGIIFRTEEFTCLSLANVVMIGVGVMIAAYGEVNFVFIGFVLQASSIVAEAIRITIIQIMLQKKGVKLDPVSTLYYVAPCCFLFLLPSLFFFELGDLMKSSLDFVSLSPLLLLNCIAAFGLNLSIFLLIGKTSALTMNVAGVVKDWILIVLSVALFKSIVTHINLVGYGIAFLGVCWYNHMARQKAAANAARNVKESADPTSNK